MSLFKRKQKPAPELEPQPVSQPSSYYDFIIKSSDEKTDAALSKYQKAETDPADRYNGMTMKQFKAEGLCGEKVYQYPPLDVDVKLSAFIGEDGSVEISGFVLDGSDEIRVGTAAKTKVKKILKILQEESPKISGELYGGKYWKLKDNGYVDDDWSEDLTVRVYLSW